VFPLYSILDTAVCAARGVAPLDVLEAFLRGGARLVQLRDKQPSSAGRLALADAVVARCHAAGATLIVNDFADIAAMSGADGVHLGQEDLTVDQARQVLGADALIGVSTHDEAQISAAALTSASYIAVGPIFGTRTKDTGYAPRGLGLVGAAARTGKPVVAIGGITLERAADVRRAGAAAVAVISDLLSGGEPAARVRAFLGCLSEPRV
jgi:thiamine-phosphate pyrophosphorylase